jgi:hypothetical protein
LIPLYGFLEGDTIGLLILARKSQSVGELARQLEVSARVRVRARAVVEVRHQGRVLDLRVTVVQAGLKALDRFDVVSARPPYDETEAEAGRDGS